MSRRRKRSVQLGFGYSTCMGHPYRTLARPEDEEQGECDEQRSDGAKESLAAWDEDDDAGDDDVRQRQRDHVFPAEVHELVEAEAGERRPEPDVDQHERHDLDEEDEGAEE